MKKGSSFIEAMESRWLYASKSSSTASNLGWLDTGTKGAELVRLARFGLVVRGVELVEVGEAFEARSPLWGSRDELDERVRFDLVRAGRSPTSSIVTKSISVYSLVNGLVDT